MRPFPDFEIALSDGVVSLRPFTLDDIADVTRACQDSEIVKWTASIPIPYTESDARSWIERHPENWRSGFTASLAIVDAIDGTFAGNLNVIVPPGSFGQVHLGYWVAAWVRSRGIATRSVLLGGKWAFDVFQPQEIYLQTLEGNVASERVAEKAGYVFTEYQSEDYIRPSSRGVPGPVRVKQWVQRSPGSDSAKR